MYSMQSIVVAILAALAPVASAAPVEISVAQGTSPALQDILSNARDDPLYTYPTALTQGIIPKGMHSHNDYWRAVPFFSALSQGAISVEADVWLYDDGILHVGHDRSSLSDNRTFDSVYVQPILSVLKRQNPSHRYVLNGPTHNGVFDTTPDQTLYLFVDLKTDGASTWPVVVQALKPLRDAGYLASYDGNTFIPGAVTVVGTGNTPRELVEGVVRRDYFWDGPLAQLGQPGYEGVTARVSPVASAGFGDVFGGEGTAVRRSGEFDEAQLALLREQVEVAHARGIKVRYWDTPGWPIGTRNKVWRTLWDAGVDLLNVDDLEAASGVWEGES